MSRIPFQIAHDTSTNWATNNPTLNAGELGAETDTHRMKVGDGTTAWNSLVYIAGVGTVTAVSTAVANNGITATWANSTTTPSLTVGLGAITPTSVAATTTISGTVITASTNFSGSGSGLTSVPWSGLSSIPTNVTSFGSLANATGVLINNGSGTLSYSTIPTLTGTNFTGIPGTAINSTVSAATLAATSTIVATTTNATYYPTVVSGVSGSLALDTVSSFTINPSTGAITGTSFNSITGLGATNPLMDGSVSVGSSTLVSRQDHVHPSDTTKASTSQTFYLGTTPIAINAGSGTITTIAGLSSVSSTGFTGTLQTAAQPNITSVGTLTSLTSTGAITGTSFNGITALSSTTPIMDGTATIGSGTTVAYANHIHPTDTSRQAAFTILSTLGGLTNASGYLSNNGTGTLSWAAGGGGGAASAITYTAPWTGAAATNLQLKMQKTSDLVLDFGADPTGVADSTTAISNWWQNTPADITMTVPSGTYKITGSTSFVRTTSCTIICDPDSLFDASTSTSSDIFQINGSRGTCYLNTVLINQGDRSFTANYILAGTLSSGNMLQITTDKNAGGTGAVWYGGQSVFVQGEFVEVETVCSAQFTGTIASNVLTLTANTAIGAIPTTYPVPLLVSGNGIVSGVTITGLTSGTANTNGAVYALSTSASACTGATIYSGIVSGFPSIVIVKNPFKDTYAANSSVAGLITAVSPNITGFKLLANTYRTTGDGYVQAGLTINYGKDVRIVGGRIDGMSWACLQLTRCFGVSITGFVCSSKWYTTTGYGYGIQFATVQDGFVDKCRVQADRNAFDIGGWEPTRDIHVTNSFFGTGNNTEKAFGAHGNAENVTLTDSTIEGGLTFIGKIISVNNCDINTRYPIVLSSDWSSYTYTASFATNIMTLTVAGTGASTPVVGQTISAAGVAVGTTITGLLSGTLNQVGSTYSLSTTPGTISAETVTGYVQGWPAGSGIYHTIKNCRIYIVNNGTNNYGIQCTYAGNIDRVVLSGNEIWGAANLSSADLINITNMASLATTPTIAEFVCDDNDFTTTNNTCGGILINSINVTNFKFRRNTINLPGNAAPTLYWSGATSTNIDILDNIFINTVNNSSSLKLMTSGATTIRFNRNKYSNTGGNTYYAPNLTASGYIECMDNTLSNFANGAIQCIAPVVLNKNNTLSSISGSTIFGGKSLSIIHPNGMVETAAAANPTSGFWNVGDKWWSSAVTSTTSPGSVCTTAGYGLQGAWTTSTSYTAGQYVTNGGKTYMAYTAAWSTTGTATSGATAPTQSSGTQSDGTITWLWIGNTATAATWTTMPIL